ncbi:MAG: hypothetical protein FJ253_06355 [Phycisphaerae bacterium]|nr:hypothetical protein [Phycisphaerae bacterium]
MSTDTDFRRSNARTIRTDRLHRLAPAARAGIACVAAIAASLVMSGCTCATCTATGCANPNYGKKSHSLMQALTLPQGPTQAASTTVSAVASLPAAQGG